VNDTRGIIAALMADGECDGSGWRAALGRRVGFEALRRAAWLKSSSEAGLVKSKFLAISPTKKSFSTMTPVGAAGSGLLMMLWRTAASLGSAA
jgi:hypothetical protein